MSYTLLGSYAKKRLIWTLRPVPYYIKGGGGRLILDVVISFTVLLITCCVGG